MRNDKNRNINTTVLRYNLRHIKGRHYYEKYNPGKIIKYNLRSNKNQKIDKIQDQKIKDKILLTIKSKKRKFDDIDNEVFTWDDFNIYKSADGISNISNNDTRDWVSATSVKNYLLKEPLIDWFDLYYLDKGYNENPNIKRKTIVKRKNNESSKDINLFLAEKNKKKTDIENEISKQHIFFEMGNKFEEEVMNYLRNEYHGQVKKVVSATEINSHLEELTLQYMKQGIPIIEQAAICNFKNKTYGIADILIRSDWINKLFENEVIDKNEQYIKASNLPGNYHYRVIDIKWTTMYFCSNGKTLRNSQRFPSYKGQLTIYNAALGVMQGYTPNEAYILSKSWNLNNGKDEGHNCFTKLGCIDFANFDKRYIKETYDAINWVRNVRYNGENWTCYTPSIPELYPNMCNRYDTPYHGVKQELADKIKEITQIWMVGVKNRKIAHTNGIYAWDNPKCNSKNIGINGEKIGPIIDKIIQINRDPLGLIKPDIIRNNISNWQHSHELDFYIDFEGINGCLYNKEINIKNSKADSQLLFLIGIGFEENGNWVYKPLLANSTNRNEEYRIVNEFINFIEDRIKLYMIKHNIKKREQCNPRFFHWSHAEKSMFNIIDRRYNNEFYNWKNKITWIDMCKIFIDEPIVIKGAKKFNLKDIAKTMVSHDMITSKWNFNGPENGLDAMLEAIDYYRYMSNPNKNQNEYQKYVELMISIVDYNEIDCKVVWEIVRYLRNNHVTQ